MSQKKSAFERLKTGIAQPIENPPERGSAFARLKTNTSGKTLKIMGEQARASIEKQIDSIQKEVQIKKDLLISQNVPESLKKTKQGVCVWVENEILRIENACNSISNSDTYIALCFNLITAIRQILLSFERIDNFIAVYKEEFPEWIPQCKKTIEKVKAQYENSFQEITSL